MPLDFALGHALMFGLDAGAGWPLPFPVPTLGAFALLAIAVLGAALVLAVCRAGARAVPDTNEDSRRDFLLRSAERALAAPMRAPDAPCKPQPRAPGAPGAIG